ncbi:vWA domain-containing protein [Paractinoplanes rishiriensis]|uniref:VWFA domain-containing protein n=1 Tax=Paractinoplanes rishiriensis TaxID=1050105 RepID=A0A919KBD8_9ACTN|nr:VWA domain-containing protein [Actinoplanes rishiriensis]GIF00197.1 hypothetical protein Ari01nite_76610 [Actinoplanes rishiriensis]
MLLVVVTQPLAARPAAAAVPLPVAGVLTAGGQTALVVDLSASTRPGRRGVTVTAGGVRQRAELIPVMSDGLAVPLVVDTSSVGAVTLPAWLSAAARFVLEAPSGCQTVVITDHEPATTITPPLRGPTEVIRALTAVRASGPRDTAAALSLAARQFPQAGTGRRVVVLYTTAPDAGGPSAATLAARFRSGGTILVVVGTDGAEYWSAAAAPTGGFFAPAGRPVVVPALDQVESTLSGRYLVRFATPATLPATVAVRVDTGDLTLSGDVVVPLPPPPDAGESTASPTLPWSMAITVTVAAIVALTLLLVLRSRRPRVPLGPPGLTSVFRGRAAVPAPRILGRAAIPLDVRQRALIPPPTGEEDAQA